MANCGILARLSEIQSLEGQVRPTGMVLRDRACILLPGHSEASEPVWQTASTVLVRAGQHLSGKRRIAASINDHEVNVQEGTTSSDAFITVDDLKGDERGAGSRYERHVYPEGT